MLIRELSGRERFDALLRLRVAEIRANLMVSLIAPSYTVGQQCGPEMVGEASKVVDMVLGHCGISWKRTE